MKRSLALSLVLCIAAVLWVAACQSTAPPSAATTSAQRIYQHYGERLAIGAEIYEQTMIAAGEAHGRGVITDAQLAQVRSVGRQAAAALTTAKSALSLYLATPEDSTAADDLSARLLEFDRLLLQLSQLARDGGILK